MIQYTFQNLPDPHILKTHISSISPPSSTQPPNPCPAQHTTASKSQQASHQPQPSPPTPNAGQNNMEANRPTSNKPSCLVAVRNHPIPSIINHVTGPSHLDNLQTPSSPPPPMQVQQVPPEPGRKERPKLSYPFIADIYVRCTLLPERD